MEPRTLRRFCPVLDLVRRFQDAGNVKPLVVVVEGFADSDEVERVRLAQSLRDDFIALGEDASVHQMVPPAAAKGTGLEVAALLVSSVGSLASVLAVIQGWRHRNANPSLRIEVEGDVLILQAGAQDSNQAKLGEWVRQHSGGPVE